MPIVSVTPGLLLWSLKSLRSFTYLKIQGPLPSCMSIDSHLLKFVSLCNDLRNNLLSNHADDTWLTIVIIALHYHCYDLFVCLFFMLKLLQYCNYIIIVMQIKLMLLLLIVWQTLSSKIPKAPWCLAAWCLPCLGITIQIISFCDKANIKVLVWYCEPLVQMFQRESRQCVQFWNMFVRSGIDI